MHLPTFVRNFSARILTNSKGNSRSQPEIIVYKTIQIFVTITSESKYLFNENVIEGAEWNLESERHLVISFDKAWKSTE